jgi:signal transduction histidine kinase/CheY-like chemotaxis protein
LIDPFVIAAPSPDDMLVTWSSGRGAVKPTEEFLARFRSVGLDRLARVETAWFALAQGAGGEPMAEGLRRDLHTLKGDATLLGVDAVAKLCQRLEDLISTASDLHYDVGEELDLLVTMALQFTGMILRAPSTGLTGIDLPGFLRQVDEQLDRARRRPARDLISAPRARSSESARMERVRPPDAGAEIRERLAVAATASFVEYCNARGKSRARLRNLWLLLKQEVEAMPLVPIDELLQQNVLAARQLAASIQKPVKVALDRQPVRVPPEALDPLSTALVHGLRNAIDHGVEPSAQRLAAGKPEHGQVVVSAKRDENIAEIAIEDDGAGIDVAAVERMARGQGLLSAGQAMTSERLTELVFRHGFSTRATATEVSGRGVGLDAVKNAIEQIGGTVSLTTRAGRGTRLTVRIPPVVHRLDVHRFRCPGSAISFAVSSDWAAAIESSETVPGIDLLRIVHLERDAVREHEVPTGVLRLSRAGDTVQIAISGGLERAIAHRPCPTSDGNVVEVVSIAGTDALLVRPESAMELPRAPRAGRNPLVMNRSRRNLILHAAIATTRRGAPAGGFIGSKLESHVDVIGTAIGSSPDAVFVRTDESLPIGEPVRLELSFPHLLAPHELRAEVVARHVASNPGEPAGLLLAVSQRDQRAGTELLSTDLGPQRLSALHVLVVDGLELMRAAYGASARRHAAIGGTSIELDVAADAAAAWSQLEHRAYHLVIVDRELAGDGFETLIARIRGNPRTAETPIMATSGVGGCTVSEARAAGADIFLDKPLPLPDVFHTIDYLYRRRDG